MLNILLITLDQFRGDALSCAGHPIVRTPNLDRLASEGVRFARHYSQAAPCSPGRASLYTGLYQMNHRVVANGTPLDRRFDNLAKAGRRAGYAPALFGYTDQSIDPRDARGAEDDRLSNYDGVLPGFDDVGSLRPGRPDAWIAHLRDLGHVVPDDAMEAIASESERSEDLSLSAYLTDTFIAWLETRDAPWFAHLSQFRPHEPFAAAGRFASMYDPADMPAPIAASDERHWLHDAFLRHPRLAAPTDPDAVRRMKAQYFGMVSEADHQLGRVFAALERLGQWNDTLIVATSDHGEQLGDHGLIQKFGFFEGSYHILGIARDPRPGKARGAVVEAFSENVDVFPTLCEAMGAPIPSQCDGLPLTPFLAGEAKPDWWRNAAHWEFDWRFSFIRGGPHDWPRDRRLERQNLVVHRSETAAYVHFGDGASLAFDLAADPTWRTPLADPGARLAAAEGLLTWRAQHLDRTMTGMLVEDGGIGRWPPMDGTWKTERTS
ncbi:MAG: sulfatase-like hydrolase/transferase [Caulobacterales bacterium]